VAPGTSVAFLPARPATDMPVHEAMMHSDRLGLVDRLLSEVGQALEQLARRIRRLGRADGGTVALLTGCRHEVGCTAIALALATAAAREHAVVLMDGDVSRRGLSKLLAKPAAVGWDDALRGAGSLDTALQHLDFPPSMGFLALRDTGPTASDLPSLIELTPWQNRLREQFDLLIIDGGSVWESGGRWASWSDVALTVCDSGQKLAHDWAKAWDCLEEGGAYVLGIVETFA
jgi:Mrp family chromosome partitioning ATPase